MKDFFKDNKYFAIYLVGTFISISSLFRSGHGWLALIILVFVILLFAYLYKIRK